MIPFDGVTECGSNEEREKERKKMKKTKKQNSKLKLLLVTLEHKMDWK